MTYYSKNDIITKVTSKRGEFMYDNNEIKNFRLPRWNEIPNIDLYLDQVVCFLEKYLSNYIENESEKEEKLITKAMINNYVKHNVIKPPINKKYNREHIAYLFVIFILKQVYSMNDIKRLIQLAIETSSTENAYNRFCNELEKAIQFTFFGKDYICKDDLTKERYILKNVVMTFANKLYVLKVFLNK